LGVKRLEAHRGVSLFDLGMGTGKIVIQAFLQYRNLRYCYGVELSQGRYK
jgi:precorrin-6B methylase 2